MSEKKISVKINGKSQAFQEVSETEERTKDERSLEDIHEQLENVIDFEKKKQERDHNRQPFWDDGNHKDIPKLPFHKRKKKRLFSGLSKLPLTVIIASISAIIIGLGLGFMLLTIFTGDDKELTTSARLQPEVEAKEVVASVGKEVSVFLIQVGAFSDVVKGREMAGMVTQKGFLPFLKEQADPKLLFAAIASERGQAEKLQEMIRSQGFETFIKTEQVSTVGNELSLYESLLQIAERGLTEGVVDTKQLALIQMKISEQKFSNEVEMLLHQVVRSLQDYSETKDERSLWQTQGKLLELALIPQ